MAIGSKNRDKIIDAIRSKNGFEIASMSASHNVNPNYVSMGRMSEAEIEIFRQDWPTYVVFSYGTPIAWSNGRYSHVTSDKHSATTSNHQGIARVAFGHR